MLRVPPGVLHTFSCVRVPSSAVMDDSCFRLPAPVDAASAWIYGRASVSTRIQPMLAITGKLCGCQVALPMAYAIRSPPIGTKAFRSGSRSRGLMSLGDFTCIFQRPVLSLAEHSTEAHIRQAALV